MTIEEEIKALISTKQEGGYWDFKREWHHSLPDLLHDIICMANNLENRDAYIIIGIDEENDFLIRDVSNDPNRKNTQKMVDFLRNKKFSGGIRPVICVQTIYLNDGKATDVIIIKNSFHAPFYLSENYKGVCANNIYVRIADSNTPKNASADRNHVMQLWRKNFRLDTTPAEQVRYYLTFPHEWEVSPRSSSVRSLYYIKRPEYTMETSIDDSKDGYEFYLVDQYNISTSWYDIYISYHQTTIEYCCGVCIDGGRYFTSVPSTEFIDCRMYGTYGTGILYKYYLSGEINDIIRNFFDERECDNEEARFARDNFLSCILIFNSREEKGGFDLYAFTHYRDFLDSVKSYPIHHFPSWDGYNMEVVKEQYISSKVLKKMLEVYRNGEGVG
ncbi:DNA-binding protein [Oscillospiraceae bacterium]|nr:DNA-binding protein [Oscillospiraceae bacterium]